MTRRSLSNILSGQEQSLGDVWGWYEFQRALTGEELSRVLDALRADQCLQSPHYFGKSRDELQDEFAYQTAELDRAAIFEMFACVEAALRVDFVVRVSNKWKDDVSRAFWDVYQAQGIERVRLEEDVLDVWRLRGTQPAIRTAVADFKGALNLRNWLAHGRYWKPKLGRAGGYDPVDVFEICEALLRAVGLITPAGP